ncbi:tetrahydrofolate dehydrogenase/cyclohydrolase catalytic domain-containing protein, partial [Candidatus Margulisiibacteriota bacterium]
MGNIIDGKARAIEVQEKLRGEVEALKKKGINPRLDVVLVGEDPASQVYVRNKEKACAAAGIESQVHRLPA